MKLTDWTARAPAHIAFGHRRAGAVALAAHGSADQVVLSPAVGAPTALQAASGLVAGVMSAADKTKLDGLLNTTVSVDVENFNSRAQVTVSSITDPLVAYIRTAGYAAPGDGGGALYVRAASEPGHAGKVQSADGSWWEYAPEGKVWRAEVFGLSPANSAATNDQALADAFGALAPGDTLDILSNGVIDFADATLATDDVTVRIGPHTVLQQVSITVFGLKIPAGGVTLTGGGTIRSRITGPGDYFTQGSGITRAIVYVTGDRFTADGIGIDAPSRCGIFVDDAVNVTLSGCWGNGGFAEEDYDPATTLNLYVLYVDPPKADHNTLTVRGCRFERYITPIGSGNLSGFAAIYQPQIVANRFENCWDHAVYLLNTHGALIADNIMRDCRKPIVLDGDGGRIAGNAASASDTVGYQHEQAFSLRDVTNTVVENNLLEGRGAYIDLSNFSDVDIIGNQVRGNTLTSTAASPELLASVRVRGTGSSVVSDNIVDGNTILNVTDSAVQGAITVFSETARGCRNIVRGNRVTLTGSIFGVYAQNVDDLTHTGNTYDRSGHDAPGPAVLDFAFFTGAIRTRSEGNAYRYAEGGANVTARGVNVAASSTHTILRREMFELTGAGLTGMTPVVDAGTATQRADNQAAMTEPLEGTFTVPTGVGSAIVTNANVITGARVLISPADKDAGDVMAAVGMYALSQPAAGRFLFLTGTGGATSKTSLWHWRISA